VDNHHQQAVMNYYQRTTRWFLRFGQTRHTGAIHRALTLPDVVVAVATDTIHALIGDTLQHLPAGSVVADLGCGVGAALVYMQQRFPLWQIAWGITLSSDQAQRAGAMNLPVVQGTFHYLPIMPATIDAAWAIESLIHSDQPEQFFAEIGRSMRPGGILIICDDMTNTVTATAMQQLFQYGWLAPNLVAPQTHSACAQSAGFKLRAMRDLTAGIHIRAVPNWLARWLGACQPIWQWSTFLRSMIGSMALQQCFADDSIRYIMMVFEKQ